MGRYLTTTTDKAKALEEWVKELAAETSQRLEGAELYNAGLTFREPFSIKGALNYTGFAYTNVRFAPPEPHFLTNDDRLQWHAAVRKIAGTKFHIGSCGQVVFDSDRFWAGIPFEEPTEDELYILTPKKEATIRGGFERIGNYARWHCSAVERYADVIAEHKTAMQKFIDSMYARAGLGEGD